MRNNVTFDSLQNALPKLRKFIAANEITPEAIEEAEIQIKYKGYIEREKFIAEKLRRLENIRIPENFDFHSMNALTIEARQKLLAHPTRNDWSGITNSRSFTCRRQCIACKIRAIV